MADWLMVIITTVYVIATIFICIANFRSAKATRDQIAESQRQFDESRRLQVMPSFQITVRRANRELVRSDICLILASEVGEMDGVFFASSLELSICNVGFGSATGISYLWFDTADYSNCGRFPINSLCSQEEDSVLIDIEIPESKYRKTIGKHYKPKIILQFKDLLGNEYKQEILFLLHSIDEAECYDESPLYFDGYSVTQAVFLPVGEKKLT